MINMHHGMSRSDNEACYDEAQLANMAVLKGSNMLSLKGARNPFPLPATTVQAKHRGDGSASHQSRSMRDVRNRRHLISMFTSLTDAFRSWRSLAGDFANPGCGHLVEVINLQTGAVEVPLPLDGAVCWLLRLVRGATGVSGNLRLDEVFSDGPGPRKKVFDAVVASFESGDIGRAFPYSECFKPRCHWSCWGRPLHGQYSEGPCTL